MSAFYQNSPDFCSQERKTESRCELISSSASLPNTTSAQYSDTLSQGRKNTLRKSVKFPLAVLLQQAIMDGDVKEMKELMNEHGMSVINDPEPSSLSPTMRCVFEGQMEPLRLLVGAGADLTARDSENWTVLHVAASMDDLEAAKLILRHAKQRLTHIHNVDGERPIDLSESTDMARLLLQADLKALRSNELENGSGKPLTTAEESEDAILAFVREHFVTNGDCQTLNATMRNHTKYYSLLHMAASKNYPRLTSFLLDNKLCKVEDQDRRGWTALHTASYHDSLDVTILLVQSGVSLAKSHSKASDLTDHKLIRLLLQEEYL